MTEGDDDTDDTDDAVPAGSAGPAGPAGRLRLVPPADVRFERLYRRRFQAVFAYALRRTASAADVPDVVAEVFTVAWRRIDEVPEPPEDLPWLYGVARRVVAQHTRAGHRRGRLLARLASVVPPEPSGPVPAPATTATDRLRVLVATLRPTDRELLRLVAWERLSHAEAAVVLGCTPNAVAIRWHRITKRLARRAGTVAADRSVAAGPRSRAAGRDQATGATGATGDDAGACGDGREAGPVRPMNRPPGHQGGRPA
ncbi:MAG TPA: sigma-70 family RNA polymerase sigma factor [Acidimicrobiales bacterium]|nr:sigma-70 family RNA polymerase sigma factor [Acidimicrobiales bacterium]